MEEPRRDDNVASAARLVPDHVRRSPQPQVTHAHASFEMDLRPKLGERTQQVFRILEVLLEGEDPSLGPSGDEVLEVRRDTSVAHEWKRERRRPAAPVTRSPSRWARR